MRDSMRDQPAVSDDDERRRPATTISDDKE
jgi:hypothetical protein